MKGQALTTLLQNNTGVHGVLGPDPGYQEPLEQVSFWASLHPEHWDIRAWLEGLEDRSPPPRIGTGK